MRGTVRRGVKVTVNPGLGGEFRVMARTPGLQKLLGGPSRNRTIDLSCERLVATASACEVQLFLPKDRQLGEAGSGEPVRQPALDGRSDDGGGEEGEAECDAHRAFAAALVQRDLGRAREGSGDQPLEPAPGFGDRLQQ